MTPETPTPSGDKTRKLIQVISTDILAVDGELDENTDLFDAGMDSMAIMQLLIQIEIHFGVQLRVGQLTRENFSTVKKIAELLS